MTRSRPRAESFEGRISSQDVRDDENFFVKNPLGIKKTLTY